MDSPSDLSSVPAEYHDLGTVFSKARALLLPPHRLYDCSIDLLPGTTPPLGRLHQITGPERETMTDYIRESLASGIIRPSSSLAGAGFFFVEKKDKSLRPCIDYRGLISITIRNRFPLPLMSLTFDLLQGSTIFTKLYLRNAYHLVHIREGDEWKTPAGLNTPAGHNEYSVMPFGLTNAPAVFQALVNDILRDMLNRFVFVYPDPVSPPLISLSLETLRRNRPFYTSRPGSPLHLSLLCPNLSRSLSLSQKTAQLLLQHVFWLHGLPSNIVSDRGPQFTANFWKEFCRLLGISVSLSSGFHQDLEMALRILCTLNALWKLRPQYHQLVPWSGDAAVPGRRSGLLSSGLPIPMPAGPIAGADQHPVTALAKVSGPLSRTCP
ncbi:LOW QUALITY PROTEIN: uncharacterized protein LOC124391225 [Silurus meridionalis]|uniref:LOW QUALITY PROTEIN: uncharacterized protein LOC124391225 n=1 Tax=Silurus meridionalis TaxID=175797 RepID=UPI001EEAD0FE|nr:LOW QUALITY PROTEIN: uncharacterized protein LOC124391225 [Silurus meridionalis]